MIARVHEHKSFGACLKSVEPIDKNAARANTIFCMHDDAITCSSFPVQNLIDCSSSSPLNYLAKLMCESVERIGEK